LYSCWEEEGDVRQRNDASTSEHSTRGGNIAAKCKRWSVKAATKFKRWSLVKFDEELSVYLTWKKRVDCIMTSQFILHHHMLIPTALS
jgi:hypothetical protein